MRTLYPDLEFDPRNRTLDGTLAIALVDDKEREFYRVNRDADLLRALTRPFVRDHVFPHLPLIRHKHYRNSNVGSFKPPTWDPAHPDYRYVKSPAAIAADLEEWLALDCADGVRVIGYYGCDDLCRLHDLWGNDWDLMPRAMPRVPEGDLAGWAAQLGISLPGVDEGAEHPHHPLSDARHHRALHRSLIGKTITIT